MNPILRAHIDGVEMSPVDYTDLATFGNPMARIFRLCTNDTGAWMSSVGIFEAEPSTFVAAVETDETILVLEGEARIELDTGSAAELSPGDIAVLPSGAVATWTIKSSFKEFYVLSGTPELKPRPGSQ